MPDAAAHLLQFGVMPVCVGEGTAGAVLVGVAVVLVLLLVEDAADAGPETQYQLPAQKFVLHFAPPAPRTGFQR